jgi:hypothetical protein
VTEQAGQAGSIDASPAAGSRNRRRFFRFIAVFIVSCFLLAALELVLRVSGVGYPTGFVIPKTINGVDSYVNNHDFGRSPPSMLRKSEYFMVWKNKPENTYRIMILGGSAAQGDPAPAFSFGRILERRLNHRFPGTRVEVINCAMVAINSHVVREIAQSMEKLRPDTVIVYMGNNEVIGPFGPGTVFSSGTLPLWLIRLRLQLKKFRTVQLVQTLSRSWPGENHEQGWQGLEMFKDCRISAGSSLIESGYRNLEANLDAIAGEAVKADADLMVCGPAVNIRDCPPFGARYSAFMSPYLIYAIETNVRTATQHEENGEWDKAIPYYRWALETDPAHAETWYRMGRCDMALKKRRPGHY